MSVKKLKESLKKLTENLELVDDKPWAWEERGDVYEKLGEFANAIKDYTKAIELKAKNENELLRKRGYCYLRLKTNMNLQFAMKDFKTVLKNKPKDSQTWYNKAVCEQEMHEWHDAISSYGKVLEITAGKHVGAYDDRGLCFYELKDYNSALDDFLKVVEKDPKDVLGRVHLGKCYEKLGKNKEALEQFGEALKLDPCELVALNKRISLFMKLGEYQKAIEDCDAIIKDDENATFAYFKKGIAYYKLKNFEKALSFMNKSLRLFAFGDYTVEERSNALMNRGFVFRDMENKEKAKEDFTKAIKLNGALKEVLGPEIEKLEG